jgi:hypothetical protein
MENKDPKDDTAGGDGAAPPDEAMASPPASSSESEDDSDGDGLAACRRFRGQLPHDQGEQEEEEEGSSAAGGEPKYERRYFWTHYVGSGFPNRVNHAVCTLRDKDWSYPTYALGGYHADEDKRTIVNADNTHSGQFFKSAPIDVHCLDYETKTWRECKPPPEHKYIEMGPYQRARVPSCRYGHTVCHHKGRLYMYGGRNDEDGSFTEVDCYDTTRDVWLKIHTSGDGPSSRDGHACVLLGNEMLVHGGFASRVIKFSGDMYAFNLDHHTWRKFPKRGERVPERDFHSAAVVGGKVVVFGGRSDVFAPYFTANDIYPHEVFYYSLEISQWFKAPRKGPYHPSGRRSLSAVAFGDSILYFGGYNATKKYHYGDLFMLNTLTWECTELRPFGDAPPPRRRVGCALIGDNLMICGGTSPVEAERDGKTVEVLQDHSDMFILHLIPTLEQQCIMTLVRNDVNISPLPVHMQQRIADLLSKPMKTVTKLARQEIPDSTTE